MNIIHRAHGRLVHPHRVDRLAAHLAPLLPAHGRVLDIGCGDGLLASRLAETVPADIQGIDVLVRPSPHITVESFDGKVVPYGDNAFDASLLVDVLHHSDDPEALLAEAARVSRSAVVVKDHLRDARSAGVRLRVMDWVGNRGHGVAIPYNYLSSARWFEAFRNLDLEPRVWNPDLHLYPLVGDWVFGRSLHFIARLEPV